MGLKRYAAFFRGINVGSTTKVAMADLRDLMEALGCSNVKTYIQSGNVVFSPSDTIDTADIGAAFKTKFGFASTVTLRTQDELRECIDDLPFSQAELDAAAAASDAVSLYVYFFETPLSPVEAGIIEGFSHPTDRLVAHGREVYLLCYESIRLSPAASTIAKLSQRATARNWNTLLKVFALLDV